MIYDLPILSIELEKNEEINPYFFGLTLPPWEVTLPPWEVDITILEMFV